MDFESAESTMGKPSGADLQLGLATGPVLFAWEEYPELGPLIERKFKQPGDVELVRQISPRCLVVVSDVPDFFFFRPRVTFGVPPAYSVRESLAKLTSTNLRRFFRTCRTAKPKPRCMRSVIVPSNGIGETCRC